MAKSKTNQRDDTRERVREFILGLETHKNVTPAEIARRSRVDPATIYRWRKAEGTQMPLLDSLQKVADAFHVENPFGRPRGHAPPTTLAGFGPAQDMVREPEATPYVGPVEPAQPLAADESEWRLATRALELAGYLPGDILRLDMRVTAPRDGDVVIAQRYEGRGTAETLIRIYAAPYLVTRTLDPHLAAPILIDRSIKIMGVVTQSLRRRVE